MRRRYIHGGDIYTEETYIRRAYKIKEIKYTHEEKAIYTHSNIHMKGHAHEKHIFTGEAYIHKRIHTWREQQKELLALTCYSFLGRC